MRGFCALVGMSKINVPGQCRTTQRRAIEISPDAIEYVSENLVRDEYFVETAIRRNWQALVHSPIQFRADGRLVCQVVADHGCVGITFADWCHGRS